MCALELRHDRAPREGGGGVLAGGFLGAALRQIEDTKDNFGKLPAQLSDCGGDALMVAAGVNDLAVSFGGPHYDAGVSNPLLQASGGVMSMTGSLFNLSGSHQMVTTARKTKDASGERMGQCVGVMGVSSFFGGLSKVVEKVLTVIKQLGALPTTLNPLVRGIGYLRWGLGSILFIAILGITYITYRESRSFADLLKGMLEEALLDCGFDPKSEELKNAFAHSNPKKMFEAISAALKGQISEEALSEALHLKLKERLDKSKLEREIRDWAHGMFAQLEEKPPFDPETEDLSLMIRETRLCLMKHRVRNHDYLMRLHALETEWNKKVNFEKTFQRGCKSNTLKEMETGISTKEAAKAAKEAQKLRTRIGEIMGVSPQEGKTIYNQISFARWRLRDNRSQDKILELNDLERRLIDQEKKLTPSSSNSTKVVAHMLRTWNTERNWNAALTVIVGIALVTVLVTVVVPLFVSCPALPVILTIVWIGITLAIAVFDIKGLIEAYKNAKGGKKDLIVMMITGAALTCVSIAAIVITAASGGVAPLVFLGVAGGLLGIMHLVCFIRVAYVTVKEKREEAEKARLERASLSESRSQASA